MSETDLYFLYGLAGGLIPSLILIWVQVRMIRFRDTLLEDQETLLDEQGALLDEGDSRVKTYKSIADAAIALSLGQTEAVDLGSIDEALAAWRKKQGFDMMNSNAKSVEPYETD